MMKTSLTVNQARREILTAVKPLSPRRVPLRDARGCILARDIKAPFDLPLFTQSAMDGYAVKSADVKNASPGCPVMLTIKGIVAAGKPFRKTLKRGETVAVMTGGLIPHGADAVIKIEDVTITGRKLTIGSPVRRSQNIRYRGELVRKGQNMIRAGRQIGALETGVLASFNRDKIIVIPRPRVAVIATGDEVVPLGSALSPGHIPESNGPMICAALEQAGMDVVDFGIVKDKPVLIRRALERAARTADAVISIGGVSMGRFDYVRQAIQKLGRCIFWKVKMKPGGPQTFGTISGKPVFGLPGNPVSSFLIYQFFVQPALEKMARRKNIPLHLLRLASSQVPGSRGKDYFHPIRRGRPLKVRGSHHLIPWLIADGIAVVTYRARA